MEAVDPAIKFEPEGMLDDLVGHKASDQVTEDYEENTDTLCVIGPTDAAFGGHAWLPLKTINGRPAIA